MIKTGFISLGALALVAAAHAPLAAQGSSQTVQLAFGYECGDRFLVRNDGNNSVVVEYAVAGSQDKSQLHLNARQSAEIASAQEGNVELWVGGKVVASEPKGNRACAGARNNSGVSVRPLNSNETAAAQPTDDTVYAANGSQPAVVVVAPPAAYDYYYPYGYYPYGYYGYAPFYYPSIGIYGRVGGFGGYRGGVFRGRGRR
jgi:hypothetical protein